MIASNTDHHFLTGLPRLERVFWCASILCLIVVAVLGGLTISGVAGKAEFALAVSVCLAMLSGVHWTRLRTGPDFGESLVGILMVGISALIGWLALTAF